MTTDERLDRLTGVVDSLAVRVDDVTAAVGRTAATVEQLAATVLRNSSVVETLAGAATAHDSVIEAHDRQIGALIKIAEKQQEKSERLEREWQAYLKTLRRQ